MSSLVSSRISRAVVNVLFEEKKEDVFVFENAVSIW